MSKLSDQDAYMEELRLLLDHGDRDSKNQKVTVKLERLLHFGKPKSSYNEHILNQFKKEWDHQEHVIRVLRRYGIKKRHDWSKDPFYIFVLAGKFELHVQNEQFNAVFNDEVERHYSLECHHERFVHYNKVQNDPIEFPEAEGQGFPLDIMEMAIDRLSRNVFQNNGVINKEQMLQYMPKFCMDNNETKDKLTKLYSSCMEKYELICIEMYQQMKNEDKEYEELNN